MINEWIKGFFRGFRLPVLITFYCVTAALSHADAANLEIGAPAESKFSCAIAKSAYGSPSFGEPVKRLRAFRDQFLMGSPLGRWVVKRYYRFSGSLAPWIEQGGVSGTSLKWTILAFLSMVKHLEATGFGAGVLLVGFLIGKRTKRAARRSLQDRKGR